MSFGAVALKKDSATFFRGFLPSVFIASEAGKLFLSLMLRNVSFSSTAKKRLEPRKELLNYAEQIPSLTFTLDNIDFNNSTTVVPLAEKEKLKIRRLRQTQERKC